MNQQLPTPHKQIIAKRNNLFILLFLSLFLFIGFNQQLTAQAVIQVKDGSPTAICDGESTTLEVIIDTGVGPYTVVYSDGTTNYIITDYSSNPDPESLTYGGTPIEVTPSATTTYSLVSVSFEFGLLPVSEVNDLFTETITVNPLPTDITATINSGDPVCYNTSFEISATATNGSTYELWDEANASKIADLPYTIAITADTNYTIRAISAEGCESTEPLTVALENTPPTFTSDPGDQILNPDDESCSTTLPDYTSNFITVSDNCGGIVTLTQNPVAGSEIAGHNTVQPVVITATDEAGNQNTYNFNVTLIDDINPEITCVGVDDDQLNVSANNGCSYNHSDTDWDASGADNCTVSSVEYVLTGATTGTGTTLEGVTFSPGTTTVTWTVTDEAGNTATCIFYVTVADKEPPKVTCEENQTATTDQDSCTYTHKDDFWNATIEDNCGTPTVSYNLTGATSGTSTTLNGVTFNKGVTNIEVTVTDGANNIATCSFTVTISDEQNPTIINLPTNISKNNDADDCGAKVSWTEPTATDNCDSTPSISYVSSPTTGLTSGDTFPIGTTTITYTVIDADGNENTASFDIIVTDNQVPVINCLANISQTATTGVCGAVINYTAPVGTDNCTGGASTVQTAGLASGSTFPIGTTTNTFEVTDASGNKNSCSFDVIITDNEVPTIEDLPEDILVDNTPGSCSATVTWTAPTSEDNCSVQSLTYASSPTEGLTNGSVFPVGETIITYTATDASGNEFPDSFTITVLDNEIPEILGCPSNITKSNDAGECTAIVSWTEPSVTDNCTSTGDIVWTKSHTPGTVFPIGTTTVTYIATDEAGNNSETCSFDVTVEDTEKPVISNCPSTITQGTDTGECSAIVTWTEPTATENCSGTLVWTKSHTPGDSFNVGTTTVTYTATDEAGNISNTCSFDVIISDDQEPVISCLSPTIYLNDSGIATLTVSDVNGGATDNCTAEGDLVITLSRTTFNCTNVGANPVVMSVKDAAGNIATCNATVTVADAIAPTLTATLGTVDADLNVDPSTCSYVVKGSELDPIAIDNCTSGTTLSYTVTGATTLSGTGSLTGKTLSKGDNIITWTASDGTNTSDPLMFTKTVIDNEAPSVLTVGNQYKGTDADNCYYTVNGTEFDATYSDNCSVDSVSYTINGGTPVTATTLAGIQIEPGINTIVWTVSDGVNSKSSTFRVTVTDDTPPIISNIDDIHQNISAGCDTIEINWNEPDVTDNCDSTPPSISYTSSPTKNLESGSEFSLGTTKITYTAIDASGNVTKMSFNVIVEDLTPPQLTCPAGSTEAAPFERVAADDFCFYTVSGTEFDATTADGCALTEVTNSFDRTTTLEGKELPVGSHEITWTAVDEFDNTSTCTIYIEVTDTQDPTFDLPSEINVTKNTDPAQCYYTITDTSFDLRNVADNCEDPTSKYVITKNGVTEFTGTNTLAGLQLVSDANPYIIVWTVEDIHGNSVVADAYTITVSDNQAPTFECYGNEIRNIPSTSCEYTISGSEFDPTDLLDNCDATEDLIITYTLDGVSGGTSTTLDGKVLDAGVHTVVWTIEDSKGNTDSCSFNITVKDAEAPTISTVANQTRIAPATSCSYFTVGTEFDPVTITDNCTTFTLVNNQNGTETLAGYEFPVGITVVVWTVTDAGGNVATMQYQVEVIDETAPAFELLEDDSSTVSVTKYTSSTDCYYTVVGDEFDPQSITDNCTLSNNTVINDRNNYLSLAYEQFPIGTTEVSWTVKDNYGNETVKTLSVTVEDNVKPVITCPSSAYTRVYDKNQSYYAVGNNEFKPVVTDNCEIDSFTYVLSGATTGSGTNLTNEQLNEGVNTIVWTATDASGNIETCTITVNVVSDLYPSITCVGDQSKDTDSGECDYTAVGTEFDATSTTAGATLTNDFNNSASLAGEVFPQGTTLVTWTASQTIDGTLYTNNCSFYVFVNDNEAPSITAPADVIVNTNSGCYAKSVSLGTPTTSDNCGVLYVWNNQSDNTYSIGTTTVTWHVEDIHGKKSTDTQIVTVVDDDAPNFE
ncbi:HYR domain-containing protein [Lutibacter sp. A80]|uniref:HYR domain-containing protein n=1 Tax=Lutibacter sp. A80 TaxID=2918453 RepID=UPI001F065BCA|nr:HYR domain-containing protein [Lutibacter sp. A80]UMB59399.1 HYR domain-containing protein [Lutibacter sp. A80]